MINPPDPFDALTVPGELNAILWTENVKSNEIFFSFRHGTWRQFVVVSGHDTSRRRASGSPTSFLTGDSIVVNSETYLEGYIRAALKVVLNTVSCSGRLLHGLLLRYHFLNRGKDIGLE
jgi:hypothetical protein